MNDDDLNDVERIEPPGEPAITLTEDDAAPPDTDEPEAQTEATRDPKTGKWSKAKRERFVGGKKAMAELEGLRTEKTALQQRLEVMERGSQTQQQLLAAVIQRLGAPNQPQAPQATADDHALDAIEAKMETELNAIAKDPNRTTGEYRKMEREKIRIINRMENASRPQPQAPQQSDVPQQYAYRNEMMKSEFPWLESDRDATIAAQAYRRYLMASGKPDTMETDRLACAHIAAERNLGGPVRASARTRQAMAGIPSGGMAPRTGQPRAVSLPAGVLKGTGLSKQALAQALLAADDE